MTLRRIHQNINHIKLNHHNQHIQNTYNQQSNSYDQQQPPHPKITLNSPLKWNNTKINSNLNQNNYQTHTNHHNNNHPNLKINNNNNILKNVNNHKNDFKNNKTDFKSNTARQRNRSHIKNDQHSGKYTALNTQRNAHFNSQTNNILHAQNKIQDLIGPSNNNSPRQRQQLFVPERNKINQQNKLSFLKQKQKQRNTAFTSYNSHLSNKKLSPQIINKTNTSKYFNQNQQAEKPTIKQFSQLKLIKSNKIIKPSQTIKNKLFQPNKTIHHISSLRKYQQQQKQKQLLLNNRLKFITINNQKDNKKLFMVKQKLSKVVSIRQSHLKQKNQLHKTKSIIKSNQMNYKHSQILSVKQQQHHKRLSLSRLSQDKSLQASRLRQQLKTNQRQILSNRLTDLQKKKQAVRHAQTSLQRSRQKISQLNRSRISSIRSIQNKALVKNYIDVQKRQKLNQKLYQTLQRQIKLINERKLKAASQLKQYEDVLCLNGRKSNQLKLVSKNKTIAHQNGFIKQGNPKLQRAASSTFSSSGSKSFYLTNY